MTDSDDTGEQVRAWYGDIEFVSRTMDRDEVDQPR
jgi:hypothetical protein